MRTVKKQRLRKVPAVRKEEILNAAIDLAMRIGYQKITREAVAKCANTSESLITQYFDSMQHLKRVIIRTAVDREVFSIIAQALSLNDSYIKNISPELKQRVLKYLSN
jgi:AcrR family transcriptional regulator